MASILIIGAIYAIDFLYIKIVEHVSNVLLYSKLENNKEKDSSTLMDDGD
jgi:hypothetical protein